jgi:type II secretory pathway component GspD/PulD (secretin)
MISPAAAQNDFPATAAIQMRYADARQLEPIVKPLLTPAGTLMVDARSNTFVVRDIEPNIEAIRETIARLDVEVPSNLFTLKYADPVAVAGQINKVLDCGGGIVVPDQRTHTVYVRASRSNLDAIAALIPRWDKRPPQVFIEADILDVSTAKLKELGVEWELRLGYEGGDHDLVVNVNADRASTDVSPSGAIIAGTPSVTIPAVFDPFGNLVTPAQVIPGSDFSATIEALIEDSSTRTLSRPRILVLDGQAARFEVATLEPYATTRYTDVGTAATLDIEFLDIGIILETVPHINEDGFIMMEIQPEISKLVREEIFETTIIPDEGGIITNRIRVPVKAQSRATTFVMVRDKQTIAIGGLRTREDFESIRKVPLLADIPILGIPFRNLNQSHDKRELVIFITPHITYGDQSVEEAKALRLELDEQEQ